MDMKCGDMIVTVNGAGSTLKLRAFMAFRDRQRELVQRDIPRDTEFQRVLHRVRVPPSSSNPTAASQGTAFRRATASFPALRGHLPIRGHIGPDLFGQVIITANYCPLLTLVPVCKQASTYRFTGGW